MEVEVFDHSEEWLVEVHHDLVGELRVVLLDVICCHLHHVLDELKVVD